MLHIFSEEQWNLIGEDYSVFNDSWPAFDSSALVKDEIEIAIQVNGKIKVRMNIPSDLKEAEIKSAALNNEEIIKFTEGKNIIKVIVVKGSLVNIVCK